MKNLYSGAINMFINLNRINNVAIEEFIKTNRKQLQAAKNYDTDEIKQRYKLLEDTLTSMNAQYVAELQKSRSKLTQQGLAILDEDTLIDIERQEQDADQIVNHDNQRLKSFVNLNYSMIDIVFDSEFFVLYIIKAMRILFSYIALFLAAKIFTPIYEEQVYDEQTVPPSLSKFLLIFVAFDVSFNAFLIVVLYLLKFIFKTETNGFIVTDGVFMKYGIDYIISMALILVIAQLLGGVVMEKRYFRFQFEGSRAIRAFEAMTFDLAAIVHLVPFFLVV